MKSLKRGVAALTLILAAGTLSACSYEPFEGTVTDRDTYMRPVLVGKVTTYQRAYRLEVRSPEGIEDRWSVRRDVYEACKKNDHVSRLADGTVTCTEKAR